MTKWEGSVQQAGIILYCRCVKEKKFSERKRMRALLKFVSYIVISLLVVVFGVYVQSRSSYNMSIVYAYCFYNIILTIKNGIDTNGKHKKNIN